MPQRRRNDSRVPHPAVRALMPYVNALAAAIGPVCEIVLHDFADPAHSLVRIAGSLTHRVPGAPMTNIVVDALQRGGDKTPDLFNYRSVAPDGRSLRSSTIFIRDDHRIVGALCVNIDIASLESADGLLRRLLHGVDQPAAEGLAAERDLPIERFGNTVADVLDDLIRQAVDAHGQPPVRLTKDERLALVADLEHRGAFLIKGGIEIVGQRLNISRFTIYSDLQGIRANRRLNGGDSAWPATTSVPEP